MFRFYKHHTRYLMVSNKYILNPRYKIVQGESVLDKCTYKKYKLGASQIKFLRYFESVPKEPEWGKLLDDEECINYVVFIDLLKKEVIIPVKRDVDFTVIF